MSSDEDVPSGPVAVTFKDLTPATEPALRRLNAVIFPIRYAARPRSARETRRPRRWKARVSPRLDASLPAPTDGPSSDASRYPD